RGAPASPAARPRRHPGRGSRRPSSRARAARPAPRRRRGTRRDRASARSPRSAIAPGQASSSWLELGDRLDLHEGARREPRDLHRRAGRRRVADVPRVHLVHPPEVVEVLEEDRRLDEAVERRPGLLEDRAQVGEDLLGLRADLAAGELRLARAQRELPRDEDEAVRLDRLRVRRPLERRRRCFGAYDLLAHCSPPGGRRHAWPSAAPRALKIATSTCSGSRPSSRRMWTLRPAAVATSLRNCVTRSLARPPTRWFEKSTFEENSGFPETSSAAPASASSAGRNAHPAPAAPGAFRCSA